MWPLLALGELLILPYSRLMGAVQPSGTMASLTHFPSETQAPTRPSTKPKVSCLAVFTQGGVLPPRLWLMFVN